jgi:pimeloyl-ACP methyl ester carboxylesterase
MMMKDLALSAARGRAPRLLLALSLLAAAEAMAAGRQPWETLPPTPSLPKPLSSGFAPVDDIRMFYAVFGDGPPLLLLHGGLANSNYWSAVIPFLVQGHRRVIVADSRGHGRSTRTTQPYSYDLMASDVIALLDYLKIGKVDLVGWSDGGIIGLDIAMHHAERVRRLFAYGANSDPSGVRENMDSHPTWSAFVQRGRSEYAQLSPTPGDYDNFRAQIEKMWAQQPNWSAQQLQQITVRIAIADGAHDEAIKREHTEYLARTIPHAKLVILDDASHFGMLQNPKEFSAAVLALLNEP